MQTDVKYGEYVSIGLRFYIAPPEGQFKHFRVMKGRPITEDVGESLAAIYYRFDAFHGNLRFG